MGARPLSPVPQRLSSVQPFHVIKLRTDDLGAEVAQAAGSQPTSAHHKRGPAAAYVTRLDELPHTSQRVARRKMSLIGPRAERPELEEELERRKSPITAAAALGCWAEAAGPR